VPLGDASVVALISGLLMKRLAGLVEPPGGAGQFYSFWVFLDCWVKSDRVEVCGESYGVIMLIQ